MLVREFLLCINIQYATAHSQTFPKPFVRKRLYYMEFIGIIKTMRCLFFLWIFIASSCKKASKDQRHLITP